MLLNRWKALYNIEPRKVLCVWMVYHAAGGDNEEKKEKLKTSTGRKHSGLMVGYGHT